LDQRTRDELPAALPLQLKQHWAKGRRQHFSPTPAVSTAFCSSTKTATVSASASVNKGIRLPNVAKIDRLNGAACSNFGHDAETRKWLEGTAEDLYGKLAAVGLVPSRSTSLATFLDAYIAAPSDIRAWTRINLQACRNRLVERFGAERDLRTITPADADEWVLYLRGQKQYANATIGRTIKRAKQLFKVAVRRRVLTENPFQDLKPPSERNAARHYFIERDVAYRLLEACPDAEWRLIFALSRFGGLTCPSQHLGLKWADVDWERDRFLVHKPKNERHEDGGKRGVPIFPDLRTQLQRIIKRAACCPGRCCFTTFASRGRPS
jgi:hypothetical protein